MSTKGVILIGGPSKGTRMRPLTLDTPKPLLPIAGKPMIWHPIAALARVPALKEIIIIGFYEDALMQDFLRAVRREFDGLTINYMREYKSLGTAGGLYHFRDTISSNMSNFFVINADICCAFPLTEMMAAHERHRGVGTIMGVKVPKDTATKYGCIVHDPATAQVLHYVEKPESWISSLINGGIYLFDKTFFDEVKDAMQEKQKRASEDPFGEQDDQLRLEQDVVVPLASARKMFVYESPDFWRQIKTAGSAVPASSLYLQRFAKTRPELLKAPSKPPSPNEPTIIAPVSIDPSAIVDPSAKIGPNVSLGPHVKVGPGVRIKDSVLMEGIVLERHACVLNSIIGNNCKIGPWARVDGALETGVDDGKNPFSVTILATDVTVAREVCVRSCIVLPNKSLTRNSNNQVLL